MSETETSQSTLDEIDARQDEVLERLEALNRRVEHLLSDWRPERVTVPVAAKAGPTSGAKAA